MGSQTEIQGLLAGQKKTWNDFAPGWGKWDKFFMHTIASMGEEILSAVNLKPGQRVLDVATGTGEPGLSAAKRVRPGEVIGIDIAEGMIRIARENATRQGLSNYKAEVLEASSLPYPEGHFDFVICRLGLMFFGDVHATLAELRRVLKTGGKAAFSVWAEPANNAWATTIGSIFTKMLASPPVPEDAPGLFRFAKSEKLRTAFENAGFDGFELREVGGEMRFESPAQYWEFMTEVAAPIARALEGVSQEKRTEIRAAVLAEAEKHVSGGGFALSWKTWVAVAARNK